MLKQAALGFILGIVVLRSLVACGSSQACQLQAVSALPLDDPDSLTLGETQALAIRLKACAQGDGGK